jgi:hypothetical protein
MVATGVGVGTRYFIERDVAQPALSTQPILSEGELLERAPDTQVVEESAEPVDESLYTETEDFFTLPAPPAEISVPSPISSNPFSQGGDVVDLEEVISPTTGWKIYSGANGILSFEYPPTISGKATDLAIDTKLVPNLPILTFFRSIVPISSSITYNGVNYGSYILETVAGIYIQPLIASKDGEWSGWNYFLAPDDGGATTGYSYLTESNMWEWEGADGITVQLTWDQFFKDAVEKINTGIVKGEVLTTADGTPVFYQDDGATADTHLKLLPSLPYRINFTTFKKSSSTVVSVFMLTQIKESDEAAMLESLLLNTTAEEEAIKAIQPMIFAASGEVKQFLISDPTVNPIKQAFIMQDAELRNVLRKVVATIYFK